MTLVAPAQALIHAFLLQEGLLGDIHSVIVESDTAAEKLEKTLTTLAEMMPERYKRPLIIKTYSDILRVKNYNFLGIYTTATALQPPVPDNDVQYIITKGDKKGEKHFLEWLEKSGFEASTTREENTYFRQGDTIILTLSQGTLQVSFLGNMIEEMYLDRTPQEEYTLIRV